MTDESSVALRVNTEPSDDLREDSVRAFADFRTSGWRLARNLALIAQHQLWARWDFRSMREWVAYDFEGRLDRNLTHYLRAGRQIIQADDETRAVLEAVPVWHVIEAAPALEQDGEARESTVALLRDGATSSEIRRHVARVRTDLHVPTEYRKAETPTGKITVEADVAAKWKRLLNVASYFCEKQNPTLTDKLEWICASILIDGYQNVIDPSIIRGFERCDAELLEMIEAGDLCCIAWRTGERAAECGGWNVNALAFHHVRPRSQGGEDGPVVPICHWHHDRVTRNVDGKTWRDYAEEWGFGEDVWGQQETVPAFAAPAGED